MKKEDFLRAIRRDSEKFRVDRISIKTGDSTITGKGSLLIKDSRFVLEATLDHPETVPEAPMGFVGASAFWAVSGIIEEEIEFAARGLPHSSSRHFGPKPFSSLRFSLGNLDLTPQCFDALTRDQGEALVSQAQADSGATEKNGDLLGTSPVAPAETKSSVRSSVSALIVLPDFKLVARNCGTLTIERNDFLGERQRQAGDTFKGEVHDWTYGLIQTGPDLHVHLRSTPRYLSDGEEQDRRLIQAFLKAVAFTHGQHAWALHHEQRREGRLVRDRVALHGSVARTRHAPFTEALVFSGESFKGLKLFQQAMEKAYAFFKNETQIQREVSRVLFLLREATSAGVPKDIALLAVCSSFESLVHAVYEHRVAPRAVPDTEAFNSTKKAACVMLEDSLLASTSPEQIRRICGIIRAARPLDMSGEWNVVARCLGLKPEQTWDGVWERWKEFRNPVSHRISQSDDSEDAVQDAVVAESQIAGAVNCMILKLMGYEGTVLFSSHEDKYVAI